MGAGPICKTSTLGVGPVCKKQDTGVRSGARNNVVKISLISLLHIVFLNSPFHMFWATHHYRYICPEPHTNPAFACRTCGVELKEEKRAAAASTRSYEDVCTEFLLGLGQQKIAMKMSFDGQVQKNEQLIDAAKSFFHSHST